MQLLDKVLTNLNLCGVSFSFQGNANPSIITGWQPFYNATFDGTFEKAYTTVASVNYDQESAKTTAGIVYTQKVTFILPNSDQYRADRIALIHKLKYVKLHLSEGQDIIIGRNDYFQNKKPNIKVSENHQRCAVEISNRSIYPTAYTPRANAYGLPSLIPLSF